jgi:hypothetical protein
MYTDTIRTLDKRWLDKDGCFPLLLSLWERLEWGSRWRKILFLQPARPLGQRAHTDREVSQWSTKARLRLIAG